MLFNIRNIEIEEKLQLVIIISLLTNINTIND